MTTIANLEARGDLVHIDARLDPGVMPCRSLYAIPSFTEWLESKLPCLETRVIGGVLSPLEQVDALFDEYVSGEDMDDDRRFKKLFHNPEYYIWEFKTTDVRIFGWVPKRDMFICTYGDLRDEIDLHKSFTQYILKSVYERSSLDLDEPKYVHSGKYNDVLSSAN